MGFDKNRFDGEVDEELICAICTSVLEEPLQAPVCEHTFCSTCIKEWLTRKNSCPIDRQPLSLNELKSAPRILRNLLSRLNIVCDNAQFGCKEILKLECLSIHRTECEYNPKRPTECNNGCGLIIPKDEIQNHNCIKDLRIHFEKEIKKLEKKHDELKSYLNSLDCLRHLFPETLNSPNTSNEVQSSTSTNNQVIATTSTPANANQIPKRTHFWVYTLPRARVLRWGGLISTPDIGIQTLVRNSLLDSGCPTTTVNELMENSHERKWPPGLSTLEIRQMNRQFFDNYVCRKIAGHQAVVVLSCENQHMSNEMIMEPGLVMIFAHGIELEFM